MATIRFEGRNAQFFSTLRSRIDQYFTENNIKPTGNWKLYTKTIVFSLILVGSYLSLILFTTDQTWIQVGLCMLLGLSFAGMGFNVMHDGAHGSYSTKPWINKLMANSLNLLGGNAFYWVEKHNVAHHSYTNIDGADEDIDIYPFMRLNSNQKGFWIHKFQHIYFIFLYSIAYLSWILLQDMTKYFTGKVAHREMKGKMSGFEHFEFWASKLVYIGIFIVIPTYIFGIGTAIIGYLIVALTTGICITVVFQLAHVVEGLNFVAHNDDVVVVQDDWATHQIHTTSNFATKNKIWTWLLGGLNFQVEHHLFPKISHIHYPKINEIVKKTCADFNVKYQEFPTMLKAIKSHMAYLKQIGNLQTS
jgi:linoleoyl-CoA desaturase